MRLRPLNGAEATFCVYFTNSKWEDSMPRRCFHLTLLVTCLCAASLQAQSHKAPTGMFNDLDDVIAGDAIILHGKQLFLDDYLIAESQDVRKVYSRIRPNATRLAATRCYLVAIRTARQRHG